MSAFKPTLAVNADMAKIQYSVYASPKLDGIRCSIVGGKALTRTLKAIPNQHIARLLANPKFDGLDGELIIGDPTSKTVYTDTVSGVMRVNGEPDFTYYVFDLHDVPSDYSKRLGELSFRSMGMPPNIKLLSHTSVADEAELLAYETAKVDEGYEGLILRSPSAPYKYGRSTVNEGYLLKLKRFEDAECEIIGIEEEMHNGNEAERNELGRTKRSSAKAGKTGKGTMGALVVRGLNGMFKDVEFNIGTGFTAAQRAGVWAIGSTHKYKFFPVGVKDRPRHPVYLGPRPPGA